MSMTPGDTKVLILGITEAYVAQVLENTSENYSLGSEIRIPGISDVTVTATTKNVTSTGDEVQQGNDIIKQGYSIKFSNQKIPLEAAAMINGGTLIQQDGKISLLESGSDVPAEFNFHFKTNKVNGKPSDFHEEFYVVKGLLDIGPKSGDYATCSFEGNAYGRQMPETNMVLVNGVQTQKISQYPFRNQSFNEVEQPIANTAASLTLASAIKSGSVGGTVGVTLNGTNFLNKTAAETIANYTVSAGTTDLTLTSAEQLNDNTVLLTFTGTAAAGALTITAKAAACANGVDSNSATYTVAA